MPAGLGQLGENICASWMIFIIIAKNINALSGKNIVHLYLYIEIED